MLAFLPWGSWAAGMPSLWAIGARWVITRLQDGLSHRAPPAKDLVEVQQAPLRLMLPSRQLQHPQPLFLLHLLPPQLALALAPFPKAAASGLHYKTLLGQCVCRILTLAAQSA